MEGVGGGAGERDEERGEKRLVWRFALTLGSIPVSPCLGATSSVFSSIVCCGSRDI